MNRRTIITVSRFGKEDTIIHLPSHHEFLAIHTLGIDSKTEKLNNRESLLLVVVPEGILEHLNLQDKLKKLEELIKLQINT